MKTSPFAAAVALLAAALVLLTGLASPALAHDALKSSDPAKDATLKTVDRVSLTFTAKVRMPFVIVRDAGGADQQLGKPKADGSEVTQELKGVLPDGKYTLAYRVVSSDGHPIEGEIPFTVKGAPEPSETASAPAAATPTAAAATAAATPTLAAAEEPSSGGFPVWLLIVVGALAGIGFGLLISMRNKKP